ncbi:MAG: PAS domain S-box protein [Candidatus Sumerlaeia bacterium]
MTDRQASNEAEDPRGRSGRAASEREAALRDGEAVIHAFFDGAAVGAALLSLEGRFVSVNDRYCQIAGYAREEMLSGLTPLDLIPPDQRDEVRDRFMPFLRGETPAYDCEHRYRRKDGGEIWIHATAGMIRDRDGNPLRVAAIVEDITERKRAEETLLQSRRDLDLMNQTLEQRVAERTAEAEARAAQLRKLAGELSRTEQRERRRFAQMLHDHLQQLLVGAKFNASIIERRIGDEGLLRRLRYMIELLDQSIAASRSLTVELSPPILFEGKLVPALRWLARWMEDNHGLHMTVNAGDEVFPLSEDTRILLFQSVRELAFNIVKHAGVREATVSVSRCEDMICITIEDQGAGFDPSSLKPATGDFGGFGLLRVQERLNLLGGCFDIRSRPGAGTLVTLVVPFQQERGSAGEDLPGMS